MMRNQESDEEFKKKLKNPPKPINDTRPTPEMEEYLRKLNDGSLLKESIKKREEEEKKRVEELEKAKLFCPFCRRPSLKRTPHGIYKCAHCGSESNSPLRMFER